MKIDVTMSETPNKWSSHKQMQVRMEKVCSKRFSTCEALIVSYETLVQGTESVCSLLRLLQYSSDNTSK